MGQPSPPGAPTAERSTRVLVGHLGWAGLAFVVAVGTVWHFVYAWSGESAWVGWVAPVNESVWEHTKLLVAPLLLWTAGEAMVLPNVRRLGWAALVSVVVGSATIVCGFYAYTHALGSHWLWADITLFVLAAAAAIGIKVRILRSQTKVPPGWLSVTLLAVVVLSLAGLTAAPPDWPMFRAP